MARETRTGGEREPIAPATKRKRRTTSPPQAPPLPSQSLAPTTLKVILPSPDAIRLASTSTSPPNANATIHNHAKNNAEHEPKRQKISLKLGNVKPAAAILEEAEMGETESTENEATTTEKPLTAEMRDALALVILQMASKLPPPLDGILTLWLPPDFVQKKENTLGYALKDPTLTWSRLVNTLHIFSSHVLAPVSYPNPMPCSTQMHLAVPPLPSHLAPHIIYNFCLSLYSLMLQIRPPSEDMPSSSERWALMQKTPANAQHGLVGGDWFTGCVNLREVEGMKVEVEGKDRGKSVLEIMAEKGTKFGYATAVSLQSARGPDTHAPRPKLGDTIIKRASLKMMRWKELREARRNAGFGSVARGVTIPTVSSMPFTPSFAPTFDSLHATGGTGYYETLSAMHERTRHREWHAEISGRNLKIEGGWYGTLDKDEKGKRKETAEDILDENERLIDELRTWQALRVVRGDETWIPERENVVADQLFESLSRLAGSSTPADLLAIKNKNGLAHTLSKRFLPVSSPSLRGTLDPRRPAALHDNLTVKLRSRVDQPSLSSHPANQSTLHAPPPLKGTTPYTSTPTPAQPPPHTLPSNHRPPQQQPQRHYPPTFRPSQTPVQSQYGSGSRPVPGPSGLRQSFVGSPYTPVTSNLSRGQSQSTSSRM